MKVMAFKLFEKICTRQMKIEERWPRFGGSDRLRRLNEWSRPYSKFLTTGSGASGTHRIAGDVPVWAVHFFGTVEIRKQAI